MVAPGVSPGAGMIPVSLFRDPRHHHGVSPMFFGSRAACLPLFDTAFWVYLAFWYLSLLNDGTLTPLPPMLIPLSRSHRLMLGTIGTLPLPIATHQVLSNSQPPPLDPPAAITGPRQLSQTRGRSDYTESSSVHHLCHNGPDILSRLDVPPLTEAPYCSLIAALSSVLDFHLLGQSCRYPCFRRTFLPDLALLIAHFFSPLANGLFYSVFSHSLVSRVARIVTLFIFLVFLILWLPLDECPSCSLMFQACSFSCAFPCSVLSRFHQNFFRLLCFSSFSFVSLPFGLAQSFGSTFLLGPIFSFCLAFSFCPTPPWSCLINRGRLLSKVSGGSNQALSLASRIRESTTHLSPTLHKFSGSVPHFPHCPYTIHPNHRSSSQPKYKIAIKEIKIGPEFCNHSLNVSRQLPDKVALFRDFRNYTSQDGPDHRSLLPQSPGRTCIFHRNGYDSRTCDLKVSGSHRNFISENRPPIQVLVPKGSDDGSITAINAHLPLDEKPLNHDRAISLPN